MKIILLLTSIAIQSNAAASYNILGVFHTLSPSHYYVGGALMKGLAADGHNVTIISPFKEKNPIANYTEVYLDGIYENATKDPNFGNFFISGNQYIWNSMPHRYRYGVVWTKSTLIHPRFQAFLHGGAQFDVVIVEIFLNEALLALGHHFNVPVIGFASFGASKWTADLVGTPLIASYVPHTFTGLSDKLTFTERVENLFNYWYEDIAMPTIYTPRQQELLDKYFPGENVPTIDELKRNVSLVLLNTHVTLGSPRPYAPNMIEVGGLHIDREVEPLPTNLQEFLDGAIDGAIFFSLGSNVRFSKMPAERKLAVLNAFQEYPKMRLLWKLDEDAVVTSHAPDDVLIQSWVPQQSVLAHPNVKLFVTHGGLLSTTESIYFGKPVVGIPIFGDQYLNMKLAKQGGYGESLPYGDFNGIKFKETLRKVLSDPSYAAKAKITSDRYRDQMNTPLQTAIHWVKHVAKNKGAPHLRSAAIDLPFYVYYNLDIYAVLVAIVVFILLAASKILKFFFARAVARNTDPKINKAKTS